MDGNLCPSSFGIRIPTCDRKIQNPLNITVTMPDEEAGDKNILKKHKKNQDPATTVKLCKLKKVTGL